MRTITIAGGDLFRIAADELGDATQWVRIAAVNKLRDPVVSGVTVLRIPARTAFWAGGVASL